MTVFRLSSSVSTRRCSARASESQSRPATTVRAVRVWPERPRVREAGPPPLDPGHQPAALDAEADHRDADPDDEQGRSGREEADDQAERDDLDPEPEQDREGGIPGGGVERRQDKSAERAVAPPPDPSAQEGAQDQERAEDDERRADHGSYEPRRKEPASNATPRPTTSAGPNQATPAQPGITVFARANAPKTMRRTPT